MSAMALFPAGTLATMRALNAATLPHSCVVQKAGRVTQPGGVYVSTWITDPAFPAPLPCRVSPQGGTPEERVIAEQITAPAGRCTVVFAAGVVIPTTARLVITGATDTDAGPVAWTRTLAVAGESGPITNATMTKVLCTDVSG